MLIEMQDLPGSVAPETGALLPQFATPPGTDPDRIEIDGGAAWRYRAPELAAWVLPLVVRPDCHGGHTINVGDDGPVYGRTTRKSPLTGEAVEGHFAAEDGSDVLGIHVTSPDEQGVLVVIDIDAHGSPDDDPAKNQAFARHVHDEARRLGLTALLFDSNGSGGFHIWVLLGRMTPMAEACRLGRYLVRDHETFGLLEPPESFPKNSYLTGKRFGSWVRIFGRHHKRPFWTKVWDERQERWVEGDAAVALVLGTTPVPVDVAAVLPANFACEPSRIEPPGGAAVRPPLDYGYRRKVRMAEDAVGHLKGGEVDRYKDWVQVGMCLAELPNDGRRIWTEWSKRSTKFRPGEARDKWGRFEAGHFADPRTVTLGSLFHRAEAYGFKGHLACRRFAEFEQRGVGILDEGEDPGRLADEARDQRFSFLCDEAVAALEARPDLRDELAAAWGVSAATTRLVGAGLREDMELRLDRYTPTGRWAITVPLSASGDLTVGYLRLYPGEVWKSRPGWGGRPGLVLPWGLSDRDGPVVVCGDPADTARALELGGRAVGLPEPTTPLDELASFLAGDLAEGRDVAVVPREDRWADETASRLARLTGRPVKTLILPPGARDLRECLTNYNAPAGQEDDDGGQ
jgi:hypothetical protein